MSSVSLQLPDQEFIKLWSGDLKDKQMTFTLANLQHMGADAVKARLQSNGFFFTAQRDATADQHVLFLHSKTDQGQLILYEVTLKDGINAAKICIKTENGVVAQFAKTSIEFLLTSK